MAEVETFEFIFSIFVAIVFWLLMSWFKKLAKTNIEDLYQEKRADAFGGKAIISVVATFPDDSSYEVASSSIGAKLADLKIRYMKTHYPNSFDFIISSFPSIPAISEKWDVSVVLHAHKRSICLELNHATGGGCLVELGKHLANGQRMPELPESTTVKGLLCLPSLLVLKWRPIVPTLPIDQPIQRYWWEFDYSKEQGLTEGCSSF